MIIDDYVVVLVAATIFHVPSIAVIVTSVAIVGILLLTSRIIASFLILRTDARKFLMNNS